MIATQQSAPAMASSGNGASARPGGGSRPVTAGESLNNPPIGPAHLIAPIVNQLSVFVVGVIVD
jgi:hypothetical protein